MSKALECRCSRCRDRKKRGEQPAHRAAERESRLRSSFASELPEADIYVVTYAQNATPIHKKFFAALLRYCAERGAHLVIVPGRYKNPTSVWSSDADGDEWWDSRCEPHLFGGRARIARTLSIFGDVSIQPTATHPLTGFEVFAGEQSAIFGHPKLQLATVATAKRRYPRVFATTGACTLVNYTDSKAGKKGAAHHVFGAQVVEIDRGGLFHLRQINAKADGSFIDLDREWFPDRKSRKADRALGLVCGDAHVAHPDLEVLEATFGEGGMCSVYRPRKVVLHDLLDFDARNHHTIDCFTDRFDRLGKRRLDSVRSEVAEACAYIDRFVPKDAEPVIVRSNHDEAFDRWLKEADPFKDPANAEFWFATWAAMTLARRRTGEWPNPLQMHYAMEGRDRARFLERDEPFRIGSTWCNFHGDVGINGSRGSIRSFAKLGGKSIIGHGHSPGISDGCYQVGVMNLDQGYNERGPSGWLTTHCAIHANDKRSLVTIIGGKWRR